MIRGVCIGIVFRPGSLAGIQSVRILNEFRQQEYVFEGGSAECDTLNETPSNETEIFIVGRTHQY